MQLVVIVIGNVILGTSDLCSKIGSHFEEIVQRNFIIHIMTGYIEILKLYSDYVGRKFMLVVNEYYGIP